MSPQSKRVRLGRIQYTLRVFANTNHQQASGPLRRECIKVYDNEIRDDRKKITNRFDAIERTFWDACGQILSRLIASSRGVEAAPRGAVECATRPMYTYFKCRRDFTVLRRLRCMRWLHFFFNRMFSASNQAILRSILLTRSTRSESISCSELSSCNLTLRFF